MSTSYLNPGLAAPIPMPDGLDAPFWQGARENRLVLQKCQACDEWQWGPEWNCHRCHSFDVAYEEVEPRGLIYSYQRVWHPVHPALKEQGPYLIVLVEIPHADNVRLVGNLLGDPMQKVVIGDPVEAVFEHHADADPEYSLIQWRTRQNAKRSPGETFSEIEE